MHPPIGPLNGFKEVRLASRVMECVSRNPGGAREACGSESEIGGGRGNVDTTRATGFRTSNLVREGSTVSEVE